ncbi:Aminopeptidase N [Methylobrevis pamukkalensis]|uniref:Aminopeptidase N n=1 Tax=Methylobrevis pamukkalensis TaxID=1439726 RepID=A0A1E3H4Z1_9HYPH|nr:Aminopeptidase N [Methylobrevis pamukkalensis]
MAGTLHGKPAVMAGFWGSHLGLVDLLLERGEAGWAVTAHASEARPIYRREGRTTVPLVADVGRILDCVADDHRTTLAYVRRPVGMTTAPLHSYFALVADDPSVQIVNDAQRWYVTRMLAGGPLAGLPVLAAAAPFKAGGRAGPANYTDVPAGPLAIRNVADLYFYPNTIRAVRITGAGVREWLERSAGLFRTVQPGIADQPLIDPSFASYNFDVIDGVTYRIDITRPPRYGPRGELANPSSFRIVDLAFEGRPIDPDQDFLVVTNSYRAGGGGDFPGITEDAVVFVGPDTNRDVIVRFIAEAGTVDPVADGNWALKPVPGASLVFDTGPQAAAHLHDLRALSSNPSARSTADLRDSASSSEPDDIARACCQSTPRRIVLDPSDPATPPRRDIRTDQSGDAEHESSPMRTDTAAAILLKDYRPSAYAIDKVHLDVFLEADATRVTATLSLQRRAETPAGTPLTLDGDELALVSAAVNGAALAEGDYTASAQEFTLLAPPAEAFTLEIVTKLDPEANTKLMGLFRSSGVWCTQCEAEGFRRITYFLDRPDVLSVYEVRMEADRAAAPVLLANGNLVEAGDIPGTDRHYAVWNDPWRKPCYLFALVAGDLGVITDSFTTMSGRKVALGIYVEHGNEDRATYAMDALKRSMRWDETAFGLEYDLDVFNVVAVSDFNMGAMENKGLNVFNDKYVLANPEVATDQDYGGIEAVIAHEYFHNWTGNRITCRDWFQLCLKEGLTVFRDQEFTSDMRSRPVKRISDVRLLRSHQFPEDGGPLAHPVRPEKYLEISNFYTATVYEKGAEVIRALKILIGDAAFKAGMDLYFARHDGEAATIEQFIACFAEASGRDLSQFMLWYSQAGTPQIDITDAYDAERREYTLTLRQHLGPTPEQAEKKPMVLPVRYGLVGPDGTDMAHGAVSGAEVAGDVIVMTQPVHEVVFSEVAERPVPSLLRNFSAPVRPIFNLPIADIVFLMRHDSDPFNRWQSASTVAMYFLTAGTQAAMSGGATFVDEGYLAALGDITADTRLDPAFRALMLGVPHEADIAREIGSNVDPDAIAIAFREARHTIGTRLADVLDAAIAENVDAGPYSPDAASAGRRALANAAQDLRAATGDAAVHARIHARLAAATNMTDRLACLTSLVQSGAAEAPEALAAFYDRFKDVPLVVDKWLAVQAAAPGAGTLDAVRALTGHPAFSFRNPNRIRSLIGSFAQGNPSQFARADGAGFDFVADSVMRLDETNPQVAARLLVSFRSWRNYEPKRQALAEAALRRIAAKPGLSRDVRDIAGRSLA